MAEAHGFRYFIHPGSTKNYHDLKKTYWWDVIKKDIEEYVSKCPIFQQVKVEHLKLCGLTQILKVRTLEWEAIIMDFVVGVPRTMRLYESIWVIVDRFSKSSHFIPMQSTERDEDYARLYIDNIMRWHGIPLSVISYRGA